MNTFRAISRLDVFFIVYSTLLKNEFLEIVSRVSEKDLSLVVHCRLPEVIRLLAEARDVQVYGCL